MARREINAERSAWKGMWQVAVTRGRYFTPWAVFASQCLPGRQSSTKLSPCVVSKEGSHQPYGPCMHPPVHRALSKSRPAGAKESRPPFPSTPPGDKARPAPLHAEICGPTSRSRRCGVHCPGAGRDGSYLRAEGRQCHHARIFVNRASG